MPEIVPFTADTYHRDECERILVAALEEVRAGRVEDCAVVLATRGSDGPGYSTNYHGEAAFAAVVVGVSDLAFRLHYDKYSDRD